MDSTTGLLSIDATQYDNLKTLSFNIGGTSYDMTPNAQIWPRSLNSVIGGDASGIYLIVSDIGTPSGSGLDFMSGYVFLCVPLRPELSLMLIRAPYFSGSVSTACMIPPTSEWAFPLLPTPSL